MEKKEKGKTKNKDKMIGMASVALLAVLCLYLLSGQEEPGRVSSTLPWMWNDYDRAIEKARNDDKYVLIDFWAVWCKECNQMDREAFQNGEVVHLLKNVVLLKVDVDKAPELKNAFAVGGMPTLVVVDSQGKEVARVVGYQTPAQVLQFLQKALT